MHCPKCGAVATSGQKFCENDGARLVFEEAPADARPAELAARDRVEIALAPDFAAVSDLGKRHPHNQDDIALGQSNEGRTRVLVVCDGVSSATYSARASRLAASGVRDALLRDDADMDDPARMRSALIAANESVCAMHHETSGTPDPNAGAASDPPATTIVAVLLRERHLTVGWAGDSRAFWIDEAGARPLTRDHSWLCDALDSGMSPDEAHRSPLVAAITRCLGPSGDDEADAAFQPDIRHSELPSTAGRVLLCSDGLWRYAPEPDDLAALVAATAPHTNGALALCQGLIAFALARGARDNVSVAVAEVGASSPPVQA